MAISFSGWNDVNNALSDGQQVFNKLQGEKYLDIGGGNANGRWSADIINKLNSNMAQIKSTGYAGVCYDL